MTTDMTTDIRIVLILMVKNEHKILKRCIESAKPLIDGMCILDTGSTDSTVAVATECITQLQTERPEFIGKINHSPFVNFGESRTQSFTFAKQFVVENGWKLENTVGLLLDADHILKIDYPISSIKKHLLQPTCLNLYQVDGINRYHNIRLIRMSLEWKCIGVTHEVWHCDQNMNILYVQSGLWIDDVSDGGCKSDKFERDERMLLQGVKDEPENNRYFFYLGQTYACLGQYEKSIEWYEKYISCIDYPESIWHCRYKIASMYLVNLKDEKNGLEHALRACNLRPSRAETMYMLAEYYLSKNDTENAEKYIAMGIDIPYPDKDLLYINEYMYSVGFRILTLQTMLKKGDDCKKMLALYNDIQKTKVCNKKFNISSSFLCAIRRPIQMTEQKSSGVRSVTQKPDGSYYINSGDGIQTSDIIFLSDKASGTKTPVEGRNSLQFFCNGDKLLYTCLSSDNKPEYGELIPSDNGILCCSKISNPISTCCIFGSDNNPIFIDRCDNSEVTNRFQCVLTGVARGCFNYVLAQYLSESKLEAMYIIIKYDNTGNPLEHTTPFFIGEMGGICTSFSGHEKHDFVIVYTTEEIHRVGIITIDVIESMMMKL